MVKKGIGLTIVSIIVFCIGLWLMEPEYTYWGYSSATRTLFEWIPWILIFLAAFGAIGGISYIATSMKPLDRVPIKIENVNGLAVVAELKDGTRKNLTLFNYKIIVKAGDEGVAECKGSYILNFEKIN